MFVVWNWGHRLREYSSIYPAGTPGSTETLYWSTTWKHSGCWYITCSIRSLHDHISALPLRLNTTQPVSLDKLVPQLVIDSTSYGFNGPCALSLRGKFSVHLQLLGRIRLSGLVCGLASVRTGIRNVCKIFNRLSSTIFLLPKWYLDH